MVATHLGVLLPPEAAQSAGWAAGMLDSDGSIILEQTGGSVVIRIRVAAKDYRVLEPLRFRFGGAIYRKREGSKATSGAGVKKPQHV